jgi:hypothetical protein
MLIGNTNYQKLEIIRAENDCHDLLKNIGKKLKEKVKEKKNGNSAKG